MKKNLTMAAMAAAVTLSTLAGTGLTANAAELPAQGTEATAQAVSTDLAAKVFDATYYAEQNADVVEAIGSDANVLLSHYVNYGIYEGRDASATFNADAYASANPDVTEALGNSYEAMLQHYVLAGVNEERITTTDGAVAAGITVTSISNPEVVLAQPAPKATYVSSGSSNGGGSNSGGEVYTYSSDSSSDFCAGGSDWTWGGTQVPSGEIAENHGIIDMSTFEF
ncbi:MAG: hypothetical protein K6E79_10175 [Pseudobutyrivibrio sp.]|nr:hypothetical protein [Pseudobutyrivibrio sp.]